MNLEKQGKEVERKTVALALCVPFHL